MRSAQNKLSPGFGESRALFGLLSGTNHSLCAVDLRHLGRFWSVFGFLKKNDDNARLKTFKNV